MKKFLCSTLVIFLAVHLCSAQKKSTQDKKVYIAPWFVEKFKISAGTFIPINNTRVQVGLTNGNAGTLVDFENDLGFKKSSGTFMADFQYRLTRRSRFDLSYYGISRSSTHTLQKNITFGEHTYNINSSVGAFFNTNIYRFSYGYSIIEKPKYEF